MVSPAPDPFFQLGSVIASAKGLATPNRIFLNPRLVPGALVTRFVDSAPRWNRF